MKIKKYKKGVLRQTQLIVSFFLPEQKRVREREQRKQEEKEEEEGEGEETQSQGMFSS